MKMFSIILISTVVGAGLGLAAGSVLVSMSVALVASIALSVIADV